MSTTPGKIQVLGDAKINDQKVIVLRFLQGRDPNWVGKPFFAKYDENAIWINELKPAFGNKFFFEDELNTILQKANKRFIKINKICKTSM